MRTSWYPLYTVAKLPLPMSLTMTYGFASSSSAASFLPELLFDAVLDVRLDDGPAGEGIPDDDCVSTLVVKWKG